MNKKIMLVSLLTLSATAFLASGCITINQEKNAANVNGVNAEQNRGANANGVNKAAETKPAEDKNQGAVTVYDGREEKPEKQATAAEKKLVEDEYNTNKAAIKGKVKVNCDADEFSITGVADGAFTKAGAAEKVYLYEGCRAGGSFGVGGLLFVDNGKVTAHYVYGESGLYDGISSLPDIDKNGLSEIVLSGGGTGQGYTKSAIDILQNGYDGLVFIGNTDTYSDNTGAAADESKALSTAYKISVTSGSEPAFTRDTFEKKGDAKTWSPVKTNEKLGLKKSDAPKFAKVG